MIELHLDRLLMAVEYNPETGVFIRKNRGRQGLEAGCVNGVGYRVIRIDNRLYAAHRLAWLYMHGRMPDGVIDHINGDRLDNRIINLRDIPKTQNHQNSKRPKNDSTTGYLGVTFSPRRNHFIAQIQVDGKCVHLGSHATAEAAHEAYLQAKRKLHSANTL